MNQNKKALASIVVVSVIIPIVVAVLLFLPVKIGADVWWIKELPGFNAVINSLTAVFLLMGRYYIRNGEQQRHKLFMQLSFLLGACFLVSYIIYHSNVPSVKYGDLDGSGVLEPGELAAAGSLRFAYLALLISHIGLSVVVVPFVLFAFYYALAGDFKKHLKVVRYTWPVWFYVSVSGVLVYFMISPYYQ